jgi:hypothetical protein
MPVDTDLVRECGVLNWSTDFDSILKEEILMVVVVGGNACSSSSSNGTSGAMGEHMMHSRPLSFLSALVSVTVYLFTAQAL